MRYRKNNTSMRLRNLILALCGALSLAGHGQDRSASVFEGRDPMTKSYNRISASYEVGFYKHEIFKKPEIIHGAGLSYTHGFSLSKRIPLFIEAGVSGHFGFDRLEVPEILVFELVPSNKIIAYPGTLKQSANLFSASLPVSIAYKIRNGNDFCFEPFLGASARVNLLADYTQSMHCDQPEGQKIIDRLSPTEFHDKFGIWQFLSAFDKDKLGKNEVARRFQCGIHVGANLQYKHINLGIAYNFNLIKYSKTTRSSFLNVSVGYNFSVY